MKRLLLLSALILVGCGKSMSEEGIRQISIDHTVGDIVCKNDGGFLKTYESKGGVFRWICGNRTDYYIADISDMDIVIDPIELQSNIDYYTRIYSK